MCITYSNPIIIFWLKFSLFEFRFINANASNSNFHLSDYRIRYNSEDWITLRPCDRTGSTGFLGCILSNTESYILTMLTIGRRWVHVDFDYSGTKRQIDTNLRLQTFSFTSAIFLVLLINYYKDFYGG